MPRLVTPSRKDPLYNPATPAWLALLWLILGAGAGRASEPDAEFTHLRRFAILTGANYGGLDRNRLKFAQADVQAMARVLVKLGGISPEDLIILDAPGPAELTQAFGELGRKLTASKRAGERQEFVFYYSGHSDEQGLLLGSKRFSYSAIRKAIHEVPATVRIAILDSCASGAFTRSKSGVRRRPFMVDSSSQVSGLAILTSSSDTEVAQESELIGGSFFTHFLISGLRGAADISRDGKITLSEAYQYAFNETLARTESTQSGPQHPNYDFQLQGSGDLILTDLRGTAALLDLGDQLAGRFFIRDVEGNLVLEVNKPGQRQMKIGLDPGTYRITVEISQKVLRGKIEIVDGQTTNLDVRALTEIDREDTTARSGWQPDDGRPYTDRFFSFSAFPGVDSNPGGELLVRNSVSLNMLGGWGGGLRGFELSGIGAVRTHAVTGFQLGGVFNTSAEFTGLKLAGVTNLNGTGDSAGASISGVVDVSTGKITGLQLSGTIGIAKSIRGLQLSVLNVTWQDVNGAQLGVWNHAADTRGAQVGVVNVSSADLRGAQVGVINYNTRANGFMLGIINIAAEMDEDGVPIGILNFIGNGMLEPTVWASDTSLVNLGLKMGSRHFYSIVGAGMQPVGDQQGFAAILGLGGHLDLSEALWLDVDLVFQSLAYHYEVPTGLDIVNQLRACMGWKSFKHFSIYGGLSLNLMVSELRQHAGPAALRLWSHTDDGKYLDLGLGLIAGIQF